MPIEVRAITDDELPAMLEVDLRGFGARPRTPERPDSWVRAELERTRCAFEGTEMVGCTRAYTFELTMPGGALVPIAAALTASESKIYGRFGYGPATWRLGCSIDRAEGRFARPVDDPGRVRMVARGEADVIYQR